MNPAVSIRTPNATVESGSTISARIDQVPFIFSLFFTPIAMTATPNATIMPPSTVGKYPGPMRSALPNG